MRQKTITHTGKEGAIALEAMGALLVLFVMLPMLAMWANRGLMEVEKTAVANHLATVLEATEAFVGENQAALVSLAGPVTPAVVTMGDLRSSGHLLLGFSDLNPWGQSYGIYVLQPNADELLAIVLTYGGRGHDANQPDFGNLHVPSAALLVGGSGGFIPTGDLPGQSITELRGPGWSVSLAGTGIPIPAPGHLGGVATLKSGASDQDFLYRVAVPGRPELNAMQTELDMTDHAIDGVREIQFEEHTLASIDASGFCNDPQKNGRIFYDPNEGLYICDNGNPEVFNHTGNSLRLAGADVVVNGDFIPKPDCPAGTGSSPRLYAFPAIVAEGSPAGAIHSFQAWATDLVTEWQVHLRVKNPDDQWVYPGPNYGRVGVMVICD